MLYDSLTCLSQLSLFMQSDKASIVDALVHVENVKEKFLAMKEDTGERVAEFMNSYSSHGAFQGVTLRKLEGDEDKFVKLRVQFFQALLDNIEQRFPSTQLMHASSVLSSKTWPADPLKKALFGETEVAYLCTHFQFDSHVAAQTVLEYSLFKKGQGLGEKLQFLLQLLKVLPISSAACERGFSQMNLHHTSLRNKLVVERVSHLMMLSINGPPLSHWNARKYVLSWLKSGKHGALDKPTGLAKQISVLGSSAKLFL